MDDKGKPKSLAVSEKINILAQVDLHIGAHAEQASQLRISLPTLNTTAKNYEETERSFIQCITCSKQWRSMKFSPLYKMESVVAAEFKQARQSYASIASTNLKRQACFHTTTQQNSHFSRTMWS
jgi:hypothetical protein